MVPLPADIVRFVARTFRSDDHEQAIQLLRHATIDDDSKAEDRLVRCAAVAAAGSLHQLSYFVDLLRIDFRDVIIAGEYELRNGSLARIRDLSQPL
jgi:hypothetical protein